MDKRYIPSLIIFAKGMMITAIGVLFKFLDKKQSDVLFGIGGFLILAALIVFIVMRLNKPKTL